MGPSTGMQGYFVIENNDTPAPYQIRMISSGNGPDNMGWEHVSVSVQYSEEGDRRNPTWLEMKLVKYLFWGPDETVIEFHPKAAEYKNEYETCLHLWKQSGAEHELPPMWMV